MESFKYDPDNCPVCSSELNRKNFSYSNDFDIECKKNGCYEYYKRTFGDLVNHVFFVFEKRFDFLAVPESEPREREQFTQSGVLEEITYWKENDRYVMRILEEVD